MGERQPAAAQLAVGDRQGVLVGLVAHLAAENLRGGVVICPGRSAKLEPGRGRRRQAEVGQLDGVAEDQHVARLDVAVLDCHHSAVQFVLPGIEVIESASDLRQVAAHLAGFQRRVELSQADLEQFGERSLGQFHRHDDVAHLRPDAVRIDQVGVPQLAERLEGAELAGGLHAVATRDKLEGHTRTVGHIGLPDLAIAALTQMPAEVIARIGLEAGLQRLCDHGHPFPVGARSSWRDRRKRGENASETGYLMNSTGAPGMASGIPKCRPVLAGRRQVGPACRAGPVRPALPEGVMDEPDKGTSRSRPAGGTYLTPAGP
jgi:hypothetical protein